MKAFVIDDNETNLAIAKAMLTYLGFSVEIILDSKNAIAILDYREFDLILTDYQMPDVTGLEIVRIIREIETNLQRKPTVIFAASAIRSETVAENFYRAGANFYFERPFSFKELKSQLAVQLGSKAA